jgi:hypothetical protein
VTIAPPTTPYPVAPQYFVVGREPAPATAATVFTGVKSGVFQPQNMVNPLKDTSMYGDMAELHNMQQGPRWAKHTIPESPLYADTIGHFLYGLFGDYTAVGTASTPTWTTSASPMSAGATSITVTTGSVATSGTYVQIDTGVNAEIVTVGSGSTSTNIVLNANTPTRLGHLASVTVTTVVAPFTHTFALLNTGGTGLYAASAQPPTYTIGHINTPAGSGSYNADEFLYGIIDELTISAKADGWLTWSAKMTSRTQIAPSATMSGTLSQVFGDPSWRSTTSQASSLVNQVASWSGTWTRKNDTDPTADGSQDPYFFGRGSFNGAWKMTLAPAIDETQISNLISNTQPTLVWTTSNGGSGASLHSLTINSQLTGYESSNLTAQKQFWGYESAGSFVSSSTGAGNSGGTTPSQVVLVNAIPSY